MMHETDWTVKSSRCYSWGQMRDRKIAVPAEILRTADPKHTKQTTRGQYALGYGATVVRSDASR